MIELLYLASQIQCSANAGLLNVQVEVYHEQQLIQTMNLNDKVLIDVPSVNDLEFEYQAVGDNATCDLTTPTEMVLNPGNKLPVQKGLYEQDSVQTLIKDLDEYQELFLVELGSTKASSQAFDLQDVVFRVDNNPTPSIPTPPIPTPPIASNIFAD